MFTYPVFVPCLDWQRKPFCLRLDEERVLAVFSTREPALALASACGLQPPAGLAQIDGPAELLLWLKAALAVGVGEVWLEPEIDGAALKPTTRHRLADALWNVSAEVAAMGERN